MVTILELEKMTNMFVLFFSLLEQGFVLLRECSWKGNRMSCKSSGKDP